MVGEIRDAESARLAVQAALTGHLVLTTLHTTRAAGTAIRLMDMGVDPLALAPALTGIVSQRLVRLLCPACREAYILPGTAAQRLGLSGEPSQFFYRHTGCRLCRFTGYRGRMAIQEVLEADQGIKKLIAQGALEPEIEAAARKTGMLTLKEDGFDKARTGLTTVEEVLRTVCLDP
jgi:type II secretory ATPase GspE/PulE/Tfp pilus assembly ATPase PilB-like protein